jgi:hypothetical protein
LEAELLRGAAVSSDYLALPFYGVFLASYRVGVVVAAAIGLIPKLAYFFALDFLYLLFF